MTALEGRLKVSATIHSISKLTSKTETDSVKH